MKKEIRLSIPDIEIILDILGAEFRNIKDFRIRRKIKKRSEWEIKLSQLWDYFYKLKNLCQKKK